MRDKGSMDTESAQDVQYEEECDEPAEQMDETVIVEDEEYLPTSYGGDSETNNIFGLMQNAGNLYKQCCEIKAKTAQVQAWSEVKIAETVAKYKSCQEFLSYTFGERDKALSKHYEILDKAMENDDKELIVASLRGISGIVTSSPLSDFDKFVKLYEDTTQPLLDF